MSNIYEQLLPTWRVLCAERREYDESFFSDNYPRGPCLVAGIMLLTDDM